MKHVCPVCGSSDTAGIVPGGVLWCKKPLRRCAVCGSSHLEMDARAVTGEYWRTSGQFETYARPEVERARKTEIGRRLDLIGPPPEPGALLVDVGCGTGEFLAQAAGRGWRCLGVEPSEKAAAVARKRPPAGVGAGYASPARMSRRSFGHHPRVAVGDARAIPFEAGRAACVTFWDVLEHLTQPVAALKEAARVLRPGGIVCVATPNEDGLLKRLALLGWKALGRRGAFLLSYVYYVPHYVSFTCRGLRRALQRAGFELTTVRLEATSLGFARAKIAAHYGSKLHGPAVRLALPAALLAARITARGNKIVALGVKRAAIR